MDFEEVVRAHEAFSYIDDFVIAVHTFLTGDTWLHPNPVVNVLAVGFISISIYFLKILLSPVVKGRKAYPYHIGAVVENLRIHPFEALGPCDVPYLKCTSNGLEYDNYKEKMWFLIDRDKNCVCTRHDPNMACIILSFHENELWLNAPNMDTLKLEILPDSTSKSSSVILNSKERQVIGIDCGDASAKWFAGYLGRPYVRLIQLYSRFRNYNPKWSTANVSFYFGHNKKLYHGVVSAVNNRCLMVISRNSIEDFSSRNMRQLTHDDHDYDILIKDNEPLEEHKWDSVCLGRVNYNNPPGDDLVEGETMILLSDRLVDSYPQVDKLEESPILVTPTTINWRNRMIPNLCHKLHIETDGYVHLGDTIKIPLEGIHS